MTCSVRSRRLSADFPVLSQLMPQFSASKPRDQYSLGGWCWAPLPVCGYRCLRPQTVSATQPVAAAFYRARPNPGLKDMQPTSSGFILTSKHPLTSLYNSAACPHPATGCSPPRCGASLPPPSPRPLRPALRPSPPRRQRPLPSLSTNTSEDAPPRSPRDPITALKKSRLISRFPPRRPRRGATARRAARRGNARAKLPLIGRLPSRSCPAFPTRTTCLKKVGRFKRTDRGERLLTTFQRLVYQVSSRYIVPSR